MPDPEPMSLAEMRLSIASIAEAFAAVRDPRRDHLKRFPLPDILVLAVAGMLAGCEDWVDMEDFGEQRAEWFKAQGLFAQGTPSHDTLGRVFRALDAVVVRTCFAQWVQQAMGTVRGVVAIDGKTARGTADGDTRGAIHTVSERVLAGEHAWLEQGIVGMLGTIPAPGETQREPVKKPKREVEPAGV